MFIHNKTGNLVSGRIARDPEEKVFNSGKSKVTFSVIYGDDLDNMDDNGRPRGLFLQIDAWGAIGRDALVLTKGDYCMVTGRLDSHEYNGKKYTTLVADAIYSDVSAQMRIIAGGVAGDAPGTNSDNLKNTIKSDPFAELSGDDDGELPF